MKDVAIVGQFCAGKTTLADYLVDHHGYTRVSFAGRLKEIAATVYNQDTPIPKDAWFNGFRQNTDLNGPYIRNLSGRQLLQQLGQAVKQLDELFWVKWLLRDMDEGVYGAGPFVTDDCRFDFEADALRERGFDVVKIETPERERFDRYQRLYGRFPNPEELGHPSETEVVNIYFDHELDGTRPVEDIAKQLVVLLRA